MKQYLELLRRAHEAPVRTDRTGTGTSGIFGAQIGFDLLEGFPLLTTKKVWAKGVVHELLWMLSGSTNTKYLVDNGVHIWDEWADSKGDLGPVYGAQWRSWPGRLVKRLISDVPDNTCYVETDHVYATMQEPVDQVAKLMRDLKENPFSRRLMVSAWNPAEVDRMALPPCHCLFQFYVSKATFVERMRCWSVSSGVSLPEELSPDAILDYSAQMDAAGVPTLALSCKLYQRSADIFLGVPFNIASYSLLTHMVAHCSGMIAKEFIWTGGDCHLYLNHRQQAEEQLSRTPGMLPSLRLNPDVRDIFAFKFEDIEFPNYHPQPAIPAPVSV